MSNLRRGGVLCFALLAASATGILTGFAADGQMLARPGWVGSGLSTEMWWKHPVVYEIDVRSFRDSDGDGVGDLKGILERLDYVQSLGADAILLDPMVGASGAPEATGAQAAAGPVRLIDPALGTLDDFDKLSEEASRRNIRILLNVVEPDLGIVRFWLNHGVAGFHPVAATAGAPRTAVGAKATADELKKLLGSFSGQRILIGDADAPDVSRSAQLVLEPSVLLGDAGLNAAKLRAALEPVVALERGAGAKAVGAGKSAAAKSSGWPMLVSDGYGKARSVTRYGDGAHDTEIAKLIATVLLGTRTAAVIDDGQELALAGGASGQAMIAWGENPVKPEAVPDAGDAPAAATPPPAPKPAVSDVYVPYVPPKPKPKPWVPPAGSVAAQDADPQSMLSFYRQLSQLHRGTSAMHDGETIFLNHDDQNVLVWVRKPKAITPLSPAIVVLCNVSDKPVTLSLKAETTKLGIRGSFLRTVLRSDAALGSMDLQSMTLAPFQVYLGAVKY